MWKQNGLTEGTCAVGVNGSWPARGLTISSLGSPSSKTVYTESLFQWGSAAVGESAWRSVVFSLRWQAQLTTSLLNVNAYMGITDDEEYDDNSGYWIQYESTTGTWECVSGGFNSVLTETTDTAIVPVANQRYAFRLDFVGDSFSGGYRSVFYIDGVEVANHSTNDSRLITDDPAKIAFKVQPTTASARNLVISPVTFMYYFPNFGREWSPYE